MKANSPVDAAPEPGGEINLRKARAKVSGGTAYTFKKLQGRPVHRVLKDGKQTDMFVHQDNDCPGYRYVIWREGQKLGRFSSLADVRKAMVLRNL